MSFKVGEIAKTNSYLFADLIEILVAINYFKKVIVSKNDIEDIIERNAISAEELDDEYLFEGEDGSSRHNRYESYIDDAWFMLSHRATIFSHSYPFIIEDESLSIRKKLSSSQYIYIYFILLSSKIFYRKRYTPKVGKIFYKDM